MPPKRRWLRISLRTLLLILTIGCVWLAVVFNRVHRQARAVKAIEAAGGKIAFDYQFYKTWEPDAPPPGPSWLRRLGGDDLFRAPQHIELRGDAIDDEFLAEHLGGMSHLQFLSIDSPHVTDAGIQHIARLPKVDMLELNTPHITDAALVHIGQMEQLTAVSLDCPRVTDKGVRHLAHLRQLDALTLNCPQLTPAGIRALTPLDKVRYVRSVRDPEYEWAGNSLQTVSDLDFVSVPAIEAFEYLSEVMAYEIDVSQIPEERRLAPVTFSGQDMSVGEALEEIGAPTGLGYYLETGPDDLPKIKIAPREHADAMRPGYRAFRASLSGLEQVQVDW